MADRVPQSKTRLLLRAITLILFVSLAAAVSYLGLTLSRPPLPTIKGLEFYDYLHQADWDEFGEDLVSISPPPISALEGAARPRNSFWIPLYKKAYPHLPKSIRRRLHPPGRSRKIRRSALKASGTYGPEAKPALLTVVESARSSDPFVRSAALSAVLQIDYQAPEVTNLFQELLSNSETREEAAIAIYTEERLPPKAASALLPMKWDTQPSLPLNSVLALSILGPAAASEVPAIIRALEDPLTWSSGQGNLLTALRGIGPAAAPAIPVITSILQNSNNAFVRLNALQTLMNIGEPAREALDIISAFLNDPEAKVRIAAAGAISKISSPTSACMNLLLTELASSNSSSGVWHSPYATKFGLTQWGLNARQAAAAMLSELAPHNDIERALPELKELLNEQHPSWLRSLVAQLIYRQTRDATRVLPSLIDALGQSGNPHDRVLCCVTLAELGREASPALTALQSARKIDLHTRRAAVYAIASIEGE